jgi:AcrR family transcriptional regulator
MSRERLREVIVRAAMPLIGEYETLTTARIAQAAGIDEALLLAVFDNKDAVVRACMDTVRAALAAALDPGETLQQLDAVALDQPLDARLAAVSRTPSSACRSAPRAPCRPRISSICSCTAPGPPADAGPG